jgi:hypothetical protein
MSHIPYYGEQDAENDYQISMQPVESTKEYTYDTQYMNKLLGFTTTLAVAHVKAIIQHTNSIYRFITYKKHD